MDRTVRVVTVVCLLVSADTTKAQSFIGLPPRGFKNDPKILEAKVKQLRSELAEPGFVLSEHNRQTSELIRTLMMAGKYREAAAVLEPVVERSRNLGLYGEPSSISGLHELADLYHLAGDHEKAIPLMIEWVKYCTRHYGPRNSFTGQARNQLVKSYLRGKSYDKAIAEWEKMLVELPASDQGGQSIKMDVLEAYVATKQFAKVDKITQDYLSRAARYPNGDLMIRISLAQIYARGGEPERGRVVLESGLIELRKSKGVDAPEVIAKTEELARMCLLYGEKQLAVELYRHGIQLVETKLGVDHEVPLKLRSSLAWFYYTGGDRDLAQKLHAELIPTLKAKLGAGHTLTLKTQGNLAEILESQSKFAEAEILREEVVQETARVTKDPTAAAVTLAQALLGANLLRQSKWAEAEKVLVIVRENRKKRDPNAWMTFNASSMLGEALLNQKKYQEAEPLLLEGYQGLQKSMAQLPPQAHNRYYDAMRRLVTLYDQTNRKAQADALRRFIPPKRP